VTVKTPVQWAPTQKKPRRQQPSILDNIHESVHTPRTDVYLNSLAPTATEDEVLQLIDRHWGDAQRSILTVGRYLVRAKRDFYGTFQDVIVPRLPFDRNVAHMLAILAERVDQGIVPYEELPRNYRTAFRIVTLSPDALAQARLRGLVHPRVKGQDIEVFRRELREARLESQELTVTRRRVLQEKLERMRREMKAVEQELARLGDASINIEGESETVK
jgi:hypothetical protein